MSNDAGKTQTWMAPVVAVPEQEAARRAGFSEAFLRTVYGRGRVQDEPREPVSSWPPRPRLALPGPRLALSRLSPSGLEPEPPTRSIWTKLAVLGGLAGLIVTTIYLIKRRKVPVKPVAARPVAEPPTAKPPSSFAPSSFAPPTVKPVTPAASQPRLYVVKAGDTLTGLAKKFYGDPGKYKIIFEANRDQLSDPNKIKVGQTLRIP